MPQIRQLLGNVNLYIGERIQEQLYIFQAAGFDIQDNGMYITIYSFPYICERVNIYLKFITTKRNIDELHRKNLRNIHYYHGQLKRGVCVCVSIYIYRW